MWFMIEIERHVQLQTNSVSMAVEQNVKQRERTRESQRPTEERREKEREKKCLCLVLSLGLLLESSLSQIMAQMRTFSLPRKSVRGHVCTGVSTHRHASLPIAFQHTAY